jgi:hypothetical protein
MARRRGDGDLHILLTFSKKDESILRRTKGLVQAKLRKDVTWPELFVYLAKRL